MISDRDLGERGSWKIHAAGKKNAPNVAKSRDARCLTAMLLKIIAKCRRITYKKKIRRWYNFLIYTFGYRYFYLGGCTAHDSGSARGCENSGDPKKTRLKSGD